MSERKTILIAEDDGLLRRVFRISLAMAGFDVVEAATGLDALGKIDRAPPDAVVLDVDRSFMSGMVVIEQMAAHAHTRRIPIVVVTASARELDSLEVACVIRKPVEPEQLVQAIRECLPAGDRQSAGRGSAQ
jgi:two-component system chemotaxis response regulator CheY